MLETAMLPLRGLQLLFAIICLGISGYEASLNFDYDGFETSRGYNQANYNVFTSVWTILVLVYLFLVSFKPAMGHKWAVLALDALTMLFWFAAFICIAVVRNSVRVIWGDHAASAAIALAVFGAFEWLLFAVTTALDVLNRNAFGGHSSKSAGAPMQGV